MRRYVVAYDIPDNRRRNKIGDILLGYGKRVNYSVFEIEVNSIADLRKLEREILSILEPKEDSFRFYHICRNCMEKSWSLGDEPAPFEGDAVYWI